MKTQIASELGPVTLLVSNAGTSRDGLLLRQTAEDLTGQLDDPSGGGLAADARP